MKFIHIADVHWGMNPDSDKPWSRDRAQAIKDTFRSVVRQTTLLDVDLLLIAGDLFHRQPLLRDLKELNYLFSTIPSVRIVIIAGNHDRIRPNSALLSFTWSPNVTWLSSESMDSVLLKELNTEVWGFSYHTTEIKEPRLADIQAPLSSNIQILLAHGGDVSHLPIDKSNLTNMGFTYTALGHIHKHELASDLSWGYPGSLEPLDKTELGKHGMILGEISPSPKRVVSLKFIPLAQSEYISLIIKVTPSTTNLELLDRIESAIQKRGLEHFYRLKIRGMRDPDIIFELDSLEHKLQIVDYLDESEPQYNFNQLFADHPSDMIGFFIRDLQSETMSPVEKKALYYGIDALLRTQDERS